MTMASLDERIAKFLHVWASASVAEHGGHRLIAVMRFLEAASIAPTCADETKALGRAFTVYERLKGPYVPQEHA